MLFFLSLTVGALPYGGVVLGLEPFDSIGLVDAVGGTNVGLASSALGDAETWTGPGGKKKCQLAVLIHSSLVHPGCLKKTHIMQ